MTVFHMPDLEARVLGEGLDFVAIGETDHPVGSLPNSLAALGRRKGLSALRFTIEAVAKTSQMFVRDLPGALRAHRVDALLVDQMEPAGGTVAEYLGMPFVTICNALAINRDPIAPPPFTPWAYRDTPWARIRNRVGYAISDRLTRPIASVVSDARRLWGLRPHDTPDESFSTLAQISQMPKAFDFPRRNLPDSFHYVGPIRGASSKPVPFPWERLDGRPLVYASLGTLQNNREATFRCFADACAGLNVQLVMSHGGGLTSEQAASLGNRALVVPYAPQTDLLARCALTLTHAGLNTVLDSLAHGVPLVAIPITYEQPAIARRLEYVDAGIVVPFRLATPEKVRRAVEAVLGSPRIVAAAGRMKAQIDAAGGNTRAVDIIEQALRLDVRAGRTRSPQLKVSEIQE